jgi:predicted ATP-grasp superfamily ATP-dependent carboligase
VAYSNKSGFSLRILLSEGSSTSAREAITALGLKGHHVEICDPDPYCFCRFSRFIAHYHRCPAMGADPQGFWRFIENLLNRRHFDVLLPIHEQGLLFARMRERLEHRVAIALPDFETYERALSKAGFSRILAELDLPQPETTMLADVRALRDFDRFPFIVKTAIGTASRAVWLIAAAEDRERAIAEIGSTPYSDTSPILVQELVVGPIEHAQAVFCRGRLVAMHANRQLMRGAGGGPAMKESVRRPLVRAHLERLGSHLNWHGALSLDYILDERANLPRYIDCNPRLVEPVAALLAGLDLTELLLRVSLGEEPPAAPDDREGVRSHLAVQALLGCALRNAARRDLLREAWYLLSHREPYAGSFEELTPLRWDWPSAVPAVITFLLLLADPRCARTLPAKGWGTHLLNPETIRIIREEIGIRPPPGEGQDGNAIGRAA